MPSSDDDHPRKTIFAIASFEQALNKLFRNLKHIQNLLRKRLHSDELSSFCTLVKHDKNYTKKNETSTYGSSTKKYSHEVFSLASESFEARPLWRKLDA